MSFLTRSSAAVIFFSSRICLTGIIRTPCRNYRKGLRRRPIAVAETESQSWDDAEQRSKHFAGAFYESKTNHSSQTETETPEPQINFEPNPDNFERLPPYEKLGEKNSQFTKTIALLKSRKQREKQGLMLLEGKRLIADGILSGVKLVKLFFSKEENIVGLPLNDLTGVKIMKVFYKDIQLWSDTTTSPGVMGVFKMPDYSKLNLPKSNLLPITIVCNNVRDPGNMGSIIRCAAAAGCRKLILTKGCVDPWEPKVLRSACGGHFKIEILNNISTVHLPDHVPEKSKLYVADNIQLVSDENDSRRENSSMSCYTDVDYTNSETVLVIGGESEGLSKEVMKICQQYSGIRLHIPMLDNVESLNSAMAMAIIVFEMKRQYRDAGQLVTAHKYITS